MKLCLVMIGRFEEKIDGYYTDQKNINAIMRYSKFFDEIEVVARKTSNTSSLYPRKKVNSLNGKLTFSLFDELGKKSSLLKHIFDFKDKIKEAIQNCDIVLSWLEPKTNIVVKTAKRFKKPIMIYVGGCNKSILLSKKSLFSKIVAWPIYLSNKKAVYNADYVHYVTEKELQKRYPTKGMSISASYVDITKGSIHDKTSYRINRYTNLQENITLGLVGYLNQVKGIDTAIRSLTKLDDRYSLKILGGGNPNNYINLADKLNVKNRVFFEGTLEPGKEVLHWFDNIDIYLQPSRAEGLPRATIEAMSRGCPIITSTAIGLKELVNKSFSHKPNDWKHLSVLIRKLSSSSDCLIKESQRSFLISNKYNRFNLDKKIDDFFDQIKEKINKKINSLN